MKKRSRKISTRQILAALALFFIFQMFLLAGPAMVEARVEKANDLPRLDPLGRGMGVLKIMTVLQAKLGDEKLTESAKSKLLLLDDGRIRLLSRLCDRVLLYGDTVGADVAFLLLTMLIVLS